ncbi:NUDIX hydrolase [Arthrobacter sp. Z1-15]
MAAEAEYVPREYPSVALAVDLVVFAVTAGTLNAVFVRRGAHPFKGSPALPGGFALPAEDALAAAWRDAGENRVLVESRSRHDVGRAHVRSNQPSRATAGPV